MGCACAGRDRCVCGFYGVPPLREDIFVDPKAQKFVTVTLESQKYVDDAVRDAVDAVQMAGAHTITSCSVAGNDEDGWYVTVEGKAS